MAQSLADRVAALEAAVATLQSEVARLPRFYSGTFTTSDIVPGEEEKRVVTHGLGTDNVLVVLGGHNHVSPSKFEAYWRRPDGAVGRFIGPENASLPNVAFGSSPASGTVDIFAVNNSGGTTKLTVSFMIMSITGARRPVTPTVTAVAGGARTRRKRQDSAPRLRK